MSTWLRSRRPSAAFRSGRPAAKSTITIRVQTMWSSHSLAIPASRAAAPDVEASAPAASALEGFVRGENQGQCRSQGCDRCGERTPPCTARGGFRCHCLPPSRLIVLLGVGAGGVPYPGKNEPRADTDLEATTPRGKDCLMSTALRE